MTDQKKPEIIDEEDLDAVQGAAGKARFDEISVMKQVDNTSTSQGDGFGSWCTGTLNLKQPGTRMEEENPDE